MIPSTIHYILKTSLYVYNYLTRGDIYIECDKKIDVIIYEIGR